LSQRFDTEKPVTTARHHLLGGKVVLHQDARGSHRAGLDAVMLAASVPSRARHVADLGAGVGSAGLCAAVRLPDLRVTLVENNPQVIEFTRKTIEDQANRAIAQRITLLEADITLRGEKRIKAGLSTNMVDYVIMNPPYWDKAKVRAPENEARVAAYVLGSEGLAPWFRTAAAILKNNGGLSVVFPAERLDVLLEAMKDRFGGICLYPLYKGEKEAASRIVVTGIKASRAPMKIWPGLVLHEAQEEGAARRQWTARANAILKGEASLFI